MVISMRLKNEEELNKIYCNNRFNCLTITKVYREDKKWMCSCICDCGSECVKALNKVISGHTKTCGGKTHLIERGKRHSEYFQSHPEITTNAGKKISKWYVDNPDKVEIRSRNHKQWWIDNKYLSDKINEDKSSRYKEKRKSLKYTSLLEIIEPSYVDDLVSGNIKGVDYIKTLCPLCKEYGTHRLCDIYRLNNDSLKYDKPLLCSKCQSLKSSYPEKEIEEFIDTFYIGECVRNNRTILSGKELDLYYPEKKIAIEFNGDYWHSEKFKDKDYHYSKLKKCYDSGILLVSIFESYWYNDKENIKQYLFNLFNNKEHPLSFDSNFIDLNYPPPWLLRTSIDEALDSSYNEFSKGRRIFTCGKILNNYLV